MKDQFHSVFVLGILFMLSLAYASAQGGGEPSTCPPSCATDHDLTADDPPSPEDSAPEEEELDGKIVREFIHALPGKLVANGFTIKGSTVSLTLQNQPGSFTLTFYRDSVLDMGQYWLLVWFSPARDSVTVLLLNKDPGSSDTLDVSRIDVVIWDAVDQVTRQHRVPGGPMDSKECPPDCEK